MGQMKKIEERLRDLERALEKALHNWETCAVRFKGPYLMKLDNDEQIINDLRRLLRG